MSDLPAAWFRVGHVTREHERTGCTVIIFDALCPAAVDVRGGAPGTRETALLASGRLVGQLDALLLTGGSAFGLAAADGVVRFLRERGRGFPTSVMPVPIVPAAVIFDLSVGAAAWPDADDGYRAAINATPLTAGAVLPSLIGAGAGATVAKLGGEPRHGGVGVATVVAGPFTVTALVVLNAVGDVVDPRDGSVLAGAPDGRTGRTRAIAGLATARLGENTSIGAILIDGALDRDALERCCVSAHAALARCVVPSHTLFDGDTFFAVARRHAEATADVILGVTSATELAVERAIISVFGGLI